MTKELPKENSGSEYIQFRGRQTSVVLDDFGIRFTCEPKDTPDGVPSFPHHVPLPVADREAIRAGDAEPNAVATEVAESLATTEEELAEMDPDERIQVPYNPLVRFGVVCEFPTEDGGVCGEVFDTPESLNGHMSKHYSGKQGDGDSSEADADDEPEPETEGDAE